MCANLTRFKVAEIKALLKAGDLTCAAIARQTGVTLKTIHAHARRYGIPIKGRKLDYDAIRRLDSEGKTFRQIAATIGSPVTSVRAALNRAIRPNVRRGPGEQRWVDYDLVLELRGQNVPTDVIVEKTGATGRDHVWKVIQKMRKQRPDLIAKYKVSAADRFGNKRRKAA